MDPYCAVLSTTCVSVATIGTGNHVARFFLNLAWLVAGPQLLLTRYSVPTEGMFIGLLNSGRANVLRHEAIFRHRPLYQWSDGLHAPTTAPGNESRDDNGKVCSGAFVLRSLYDWPLTVCPTQVMQVEEDVLSRDNDRVEAGFTTHLSYMAQLCDLFSPGVTQALDNNSSVWFSRALPGEKCLTVLFNLYNIPPNQNYRYASDGPGKKYLDHEFTDTDGKAASGLLFGVPRNPTAIAFRVRWWWWAD
jgi:hypothetical protein